MPQQTYIYNVKKPDGTYWSGPVSQMPAGSTGGESRPAYTPVAGEVSALSSTSGKDRFAAEIMPKVESMNQTVATAQETQKKKAEAAAKATQNTEIIPPEVQAEIDANKSEVQKYDEAIKANWDKQKQDARDRAEGVTLAAKESARANISVLTRQWEERRKLLEQSNRGNVAAWNQQFIRSGQAEYSPGMTGDMIQVKENEGLAKVQALDDEYNSKVAAINAALESKKFESAALLTAELSKIEEKAIEQMRKNAEEAQKTNETLKANILQTNREMSIAGLLGQYPDASPEEIQQMLNLGEGGSVVGDIKLDEISKILKIVRPDESLSGLSADFRTYKFLQDTKDPTVEGMSYLDFTKAVALSKKTTTPGGTGGGYTAQEQRKLRAAGIDANDIEAADDFLYGEGDKGFELSSPQRSQLLSGGFNFDDVKMMEQDLAKYGLEQVTSGMPKAQADLVKRVLAGSNAVNEVGVKSEEFINEDYLSTLFTDEQMKTAAKDAGFRSIMTSWGTEKKKYLQYLMETVAKYREAGYDDQEILKMMQ